LELEIILEKVGLLFFSNSFFYPQGMDCDGLAGSRQVIDKCGICGGDNSACEIIAGIFRPTVLSVGYHKIIEIPKGAANINITEMVKSRNYIALRNQLGESIINGNWAIDRPGTFSAAGTVFVYKRPNEISSKAGESITAEGPTKEVPTQEENPTCGGVHVCHSSVITGCNLTRPVIFILGN
uniref:ADAMTS/ADAMTS-like Spacer 1 domain-containing protein n=1 Tax=Erpetoichthys calabaricus TaxID=27687 RepID=A0A8C4XG16_ERPCA